MECESVGVEGERVACSAKSKCTQSATGDGDARELTRLWGTVSFSRWQF
jgi:hypothetical protein